MIAPLNSAAGLMRATAQFERSAYNMMQAANQRGGQRAAGQTDARALEAAPDLTQSVVDLKRAEMSVQAAAMVARAEQQMTGALLDVKL